MHDVVEDTNVTLDEIREEFGEDVAALVAAHTEDKTDTWENRKSHLIDELKTADDRVKLLVMADAMANLRNMNRDIRMIGEELWERFNAPKEKQYWYYSSMVKAMKPLTRYDNVAATYDEMKELLKKVFVEV